MTTKRVLIVRTLLFLGLALPWLACAATAPATRSAAREEAPLAVIVQGPDLATVIAAVRAVGGEITHELGVIKAVGARLTQRQRGALAANRALRIHDDRRMRVDTNTGGGSFRDEFTSRSFGGNDGTTDWSGAWLEIGESSGPNSGDIEVESVGENKNCLTGYCLVVEADGDHGPHIGVVREADLSSAATATLSYVYGHDDDGGTVLLEVSPDGGATWTTLRAFSFEDKVRPRSASHDLTPYLGARTQIRFMVADDEDGEMGIDNLEISFTAASGNGGGAGGGSGVGAGDLYGTLRDEFNHQVYDGSDGTEPWSGGPWMEIDEPDGTGPSNGPVMISNHTTYCLAPPCLRVGGTKPFNPDPGFGIYRDVDLSGLSSATLSFSARRGQYSGSAPTNGTLTLDISIDGGAAWTTLATYPLDAIDSAHSAQSFDISDHLFADSRIRLQSHGPDNGVVLFIDDLEIAFTRAPSTEHPAMVDADLLHAENLTGAGVTVAAIDTGVTPRRSLARNRGGRMRLLVQYDAIQGVTGNFEDGNGHGSHVASVILDSQSPAGSPGRFNGIAPDVDFVSVKAFDNLGRGSYADVIRGIDWVVNHKERYGIRVLNLSFSAEPRSHYWDDPLNQAVMAAWQAGLVVVASAGNTGPDPMTIGVPGNVPYVITVGAVSDGVTPQDPGDDYLTSFSSVGPTAEGFVKPEVVAPGGHILGLVGGMAWLAGQHAEWIYGDYFYMSGTSQAAAVVSGVAALMLESSPGLTPDEVKCRLMASAAPAIRNDGSLAYSIFQQGTGLVNAAGAVTNTESGCANQGLDVSKELADIEHYGGQANQDSSGNFYITDLTGDGYTWDGSYSWTDAYLWSGAYLWSDAYLWSGAYLWSDAYLWSGAYLWSDAYLWSGGLAEPAAINVWVEQE